MMTISAVPGLLSGNPTSVCFVEFCNRASIAQRNLTRNTPIFCAAGTNTANLCVCQLHDEFLLSKMAPKFRAKKLFPAHAPWEKEMNSGKENKLNIIMH